MLPFQDRQRKGVIIMDLYSSFLLSVMASIIAYYICKWLDRKKQSVVSLGFKPSIPKGIKTPGVPAPGVFVAWYLYRRYLGRFHWGIIHHGFFIFLSSLLQHMPSGLSSIFLFIIFYSQNIFLFLLTFFSCFSFLYATVSRQV